MKSLRPLLVLLLCLTTAASFSQTKSRVFAQFPDVIFCSAEQFSNAFEAKQGATITLSLSNNFAITGKVISNIQKYDNLQSMTLQVPAFANAVFHLSKQTYKDHSTVYAGRILSTEALDGYEIKQEGSGYKFRKIEEAKIRQLCSH